MKLVALSYRHSSDAASSWWASYEHAVKDRIYDIAKGDYRYDSPPLEKQLETTQRIIGNLIEHLVNRGLMNNDEFQNVLEISSHRPEFKLVPDEEVNKLK